MLKLKNISLAFVLGTAAVLACSSCRERCEAGLGGNVTLVAYAKHHGKPIFGTEQWPDSALIKFNASELPGVNASDYDLVVVGKAGDDFVRIEGLKCGNYYVFMTGFDANFNARVVGGIPVTIAQESGELHLDVPVTEGD
ncbi:MAG: hypothetical protein NZL95_08695 [Chitinophagales bacterium]|nr:hypothetical protein [Chitinophagales bacterium]MDW8428614.1 hypothetical protein [Chitinophagales bacterium]